MQRKNSAAIDIVSETLPGFEARPHENETASLGVLRVCESCGAILKVLHPT